MRVMRGQIDTGRRQVKANLGFPVQSDVKKIPNAIALRRPLVSKFQISLASIMTACKGNQCRYLLCAMFGRIAEVWATADGFRSNSSSEIGNR